ncbi:hypothetical protein G6F56_003368 [Rhizopus delemar]|nr:hypothetical protein G6F56_003368 [Rhizopus delemar]
MSEFHSLANLIKRLEVATTRLEDLAMSSSSASAVSASGPSVSQANVNGVPMMVEKHDMAINPSLEKYLALSAELGPLVSSQAQLVKQAVQAERDIIYISTLSQKPDISSPTFMKLLEPIQKALSEVVNLREANRHDAFFNHLSAVAEGIPALGWFTCELKPASFIKDMKDSAQFYSNRVIKEYKEKEPQHVAWCRSYIELIENLSTFVKENFPTGLSWNPNGQPAESLAEKTSLSVGSAPAATSSPPPPPPPPPMVIEDAPTTTTTTATTGAAAVFAEINQGSNITANLRKVDKNIPKAPRSPKKQGPPTPNKPDKYTLRKAAKTSLEANKWVVENHENNQEVVIEDTAINQAVYIFNCKNSTIRIKGKVNAVTVDSCVKCGIALDSTVSTVDVVNSKSFALQIFKVTPTIAIDKCDSGEIYLSKDCLGVEILSAKSSSLNVNVPEDLESEESEYKEMFIPEQFKTTLVDGKLVTVTVEHTS